MGTKKLTVHCALKGCDKTFQAYLYDIQERGRKFCSPECAGIARRTDRPSKASLEAMYAKDFSTNDLARFYGVSKGTIYNWFQEYGIEARDIGPAVTIAQTGKPHSPDHNKAISDAHKARGSWQGADHPNFRNRQQWYSRTRAGKRETLGGLYVRSSWEHNYALYLNFLKANGDIAEWEYEAEFFEFPVKKGNKFYTPDFKVTLPSGAVEYHEVKGYMNRDSQVKLNRMRRHYPDVKIVLIDRPVYDSIKKNMRALLPDWED